MSIVNTTVPITSESCSRYITEIVQAYPFCRTELLTATAFGRPVRSLIVGEGPRKVMLSAAHHANEWITAYILLKYAEELAEAISSGAMLGSLDGLSLSRDVTFYIIPMVNPDGVDLVTGALQPGDIQYDLTLRLSQNYPEISFPDGWKANLLGVDLNLNYPAGWLQAREIKFSQGYTLPGPRDYVGRAPLNQLETRGLADYTEDIDPAVVVALHTQGQEIYWNYSDIFVPGARELGEAMATASGYALADVPYNSSFAGYKDWFIQEFRRPGFTVEAGRGVNPLPLSQFDEIYRACLPLLNVAATGISETSA